MHPVFFEFEADFVESLRCIPLGVRYKLDTCGIKLKLDHWHRLTPAERSSLVTLPCDTPETIAHYGSYLQGLVTHYTDEPAKTLTIEENPPWLNTQEIPVLVLEKANAVGRSLSLENWSTLTPLQRFALIKLSRSSHENRNFLPAIQEFGIERL